MNKDISIVLSGEAGQGVKTLEKLLIHTLRREGYHFFSTSEVMSRVRGGNNTTEIRIGKDTIQSFVNKIDFLFVLGKNAIERIEDRLGISSHIIGDEKLIPSEYETKHIVQHIPFMKLADEAGSPIMSNIVVYGYICGILKTNFDYAKDELKKVFGHKAEDIINNNINAFEKGYQVGSENAIEKELPKYEKNKYKAILNGGEAIGIGAFSGGCNFIAAYPMSPGTSVLQFIAEHQTQFETVVEQAEDEIAAVNMAIGAWYAGARGMTTTSGGGFALMEEGISLAGMIEIPVVVHIGMRPGPATGLPTRTEQGDLLFSVFAGHGEFPKIVLAPGTFKHGIEVTRKAFDMADKFKVPVILLSDQFFLDTYQLVEKPDFTKFELVHHIVETNSEYKTYEITADGISKRGVPGYGDGFVCVDSDEHDELGRLTESAAVRVQMMDKRLSKKDAILQDSIEPEVFGDKNYETLFVCWGSTYGVIKEAMDELQIKGIAFVHFTQVYPLPLTTESILKKAKEIVVVENNATAQFGKLITMETGIKPNRTILQYDGNPFSLERIMNEITEITQ